MHYHLKEKKSIEATGININKRFVGKMFKYSTGIKVRPKFWDPNKKKVLKGENDYIKKNEFLRRLNTKLESTVINLKASGELSHDNIRMALDSEIGRLRKSKEEPLKTFEEIWVKGWMETLKAKRAKSTVDKKGYTLNSILDFHRDTKYPLTFDAINLLFAEKYKAWALTARKPNGDLRYNKDNAIHKNIGITKEFIKWANQRGYTSSIKYKEIKEFEEEYFAPFALEHGDIQKLMSIDFMALDLSIYDIRACNYAKVKKELKITRDAFVFRSLCGIRFSDYSLLTPNKLRNDKIQLVTQKTSTQIQLPLDEMAKTILIEYNYNVPKLSNQNENKNLKLLGRVAGFDESVVLVHKRGGKHIEEDKKDGKY